MEAFIRQNVKQWLQVDSLELTEEGYVMQFDRHNCEFIKGEMVGRTAVFTVIPNDPRIPVAAYGMSYRFVFPADVDKIEFVLRSRIGRPRYSPETM